MEHDITELVSRLIFQLAFILIVAKLAGEICLRYLRIPPVLGELVAGIAIGPYALGGLSIPNIGPLFPLLEEYAHTGVPLSPELWSIAQLAAIILLFFAGLETDLRLFLRYAGPATVVAAGGLILPFALGVYGAILFGAADHILHPVALFIGAILTATSVGITARVLSDIHRLETPEGVTILGAAVVDDVLSILVLTIVVGVSEAGGISLAEVLLVGGKALGFWLALMAVGLASASLIARFITGFRVPGAAVGLSLALALLAAGLAESFGLAMIIGAYSIGLALSKTDLARQLEEPLSGLYNALVPVFFVVMGMLVDMQAISGALMFGLVITIFAIIGKAAGSGILALGVGFNRLGATRIGVGMLPRGEVALIIAGVGLSRGIIDNTVFGVSILMTLITTILAPLLLVPLFSRGGSGRRTSKEHS